MSIFGDPVLTGVSKASASGPIASFSDGAKGLPLRSLLVNIEPVQDLHGYDNPWPAGGGKNKLKNNLTSGESNGITVTVDADGVISFSGTATTITLFNINNYIDTEFSKNTNYVLSGCTGGDFYTYRLEVYKRVGSNATNYNGDTQFQILDTDSGCICRIVIQAGVNMSGIKIYPMIRLATETDATFAPYENICPISGWSAVNVWLKPTYDPTANPTVTIQLGDTYYGGTLDVTNGVLTVDRAMVDMGTLTWQYVSDDVFFTSALYGIKKPGINNYINSTYGFSDASFANMPDKTMKGNTTAGGMYVKDSAFGQNPNTAKTGLSGVQLCYELATPITIPLTPQEISTLQGQNNVWADSGDVNVEYLKQSLKYIGSYVHCYIEEMGRM